MNRNHPFHDLLKPFGIRIDLHGKPVHDPCDQSVDKAHVLILLKVLTLFPVKEGVGKTSGTPWKSREFVIETQDQYPKRICLQVMNANMDRFPMEEGMEVSVKFDISTRERDGRYFNTLTAWDITVLNSRPSNQEGENR